MLVGRSLAARRVMNLIEQIAATSAPVVITGENGTGKELAAKSIHAGSERRNRPFVAINCAAVPETLIESELFGHERGAFTGAHQQRGVFPELRRNLSPRTAGCAAQNPRGWISRLFLCRYHSHL